MNAIGNGTGTGKTVLVLGGGVGGVTVANELRRRLRSDHRVVLVDKSAEHLYAPSLLWLMVGLRRRAELSKDLRAMVRPGVEVIQAAVEGLDPEQRQVSTGGQRLDYDVLVVSLGADLAPDALPGYSAAAHNFFDLDGAARLWEALRGFTGGRVAVAISALPFKCPAAPYEAALLVEHALRRQGVRARSELTVYTPEPQPMPVAGPIMGQAVTGLLKQRGIAYQPNRPLQAVDPERRELVFRDGSREPFDLLLAVPPHRPPEAIKSSPLAGETGWVPVDRRTLETRFDGIYALGDVAAITLANGKPLPKAGVFAHGEAMTVAAEVAARLQGGQPQTFGGAGYCWVETGGGRAAFATGNFYAEPDPRLQLREPGAVWHVGKVFFERYWMGHGLGRTASELALKTGSRLLGVGEAL
ncbi:MAG: NAD(P)/FAD-dependent oxidoreductase [Chloroflexota bacterium]